MSFSIIAAIGREREIGIGGRLPWDLSEDRSRFKEITSRHVVIMGRRTFESIIQSLGHPLPNRKNIIITRNPDFPIPQGCIIAHSLEEAFNLAETDSEVFVIGGGEIFSEALPLVDKMYLTMVDIKVTGADTHFPNFNLGEWQVRQVGSLIASEKNSHNASFVIYERRK